MQADAAAAKQPKGSAAAVRATPLFHPVVYSQSSEELDDDGSTKMSTPLRTQVSVYLSLSL